MGFFNFCPKCGSKNNEFIHQRRFVCFDCGMVYFHNVATAVAVIIEKDGKILFTVRNRMPQEGKLDLPGGFTEPDETAEETCSRELREELGFLINPIDFKYIESQPNDYIYKETPYKTEDLIFTTELPLDSEIKIEAAEIREVVWIAKSLIDFEKIAFKSLSKAVRNYLEK